MNNISRKTMDLVQLALFSAIIVMLAMVPGLGYIPLGVINATTIHIPVIVGAVLLGPKKGAILVAVFGTTSVINATINPSLTSIIFSPVISASNGGALSAVKSIIVCYVPRILIGVVAYYVFVLFKKVFKKLKSGVILALGVAGVCASMTNTLLVMNLIYLFFSNEYAAARGLTVDALYGAILAIIGTCGIPEAIVAAIITIGVCRVFFKSRILSTEK